jgi:magnesium-transporting ATPase (P-type)
VWPSSVILGDHVDTIRHRGRGLVAGVGYLFACRSLRLPIWRIGLLTNRWVWGGAAVMLLTQLAVTYVPFMNTLLHTAPIDLWWWGIMSGVGALIFGIAELK